MAKKRREKDASNIKLKHPDRSGPSEPTLLQLADERNLFQQALDREKELKRQKTRASKSSGESDNDEDDDEKEAEVAGLPPRVEQIMDTLLWTISLSMLHFTLDVLVQNQYAVELSWHDVSVRTGRAFLVFVLLFYTLHQHPSDPTLLRGLPARFQNPLRQAIFFAASVGAGCYLIYITNIYSYLAVMKQAPPLGCLWVWSVIELDLAWAVLSLACSAAFLWQGGYDFK